MGTFDVVKQMAAEGEIFGVIYFIYLFIITIIIFLLLLFFL